MWENWNTGLKMSHYFKDLMNLILILQDQSNVKGFIYLYSRICHLLGKQIFELY